ncbi:MAG: FMN-binding protein [Clostridiales bacterium]|nr:FMN-binding protein [Clostridiales bacterium]
MKKNPWIVLCIITIIAGLVLGLTDMITREPIKEQEEKALQASLSKVMPEAEFVPMEDAKGLEGLYEAKKGDETVGYVGKITVTGYKPGIVIVMGVDMEGKITGIDVGGTSFSETAGLGTRTREPKFTDQFVGLEASPVVDENVDALTGATISSTAVITGASTIYDAIAAQMAE